jgi:hypothetical protein
LDDATGASDDPARAVAEPFELVAPALRAAGWPVAPQAAWGGDRHLSVVRGPRDQKRGAISWRDFKRPDDATFEAWRLQAGEHNTAIVLRSDIARLIAFDGDIDSPARARAVEGVIRGIIGDAPCRLRAGSERFLMVARLVGERLTNRTLTFSDEAGGKLEILTSAIVTAFGSHFRDGQALVWDRDLRTISPTHLPEVSAWQLAEIERRLAAIAPIRAPARAGGQLSVQGHGDVTVVRRDDDATVRDGDGMAIDGRERLLNRMAFETIRHRSNSGAAPAAILSALIAEFRAQTSPEGWSDDRLARDAWPKIIRKLGQLSAGLITPSGLAIAAASGDYTVPAGLLPPPVDDSLQWLVGKAGEEVDRARALNLVTDRKKRPEDVAHDRRARAIRPYEERRPDLDAIGAAVRGGCVDFVQAARARAADPASDPGPVMLQDSQPGSGKSFANLREMVTDFGREPLPRRDVAGKAIQQRVTVFSPTVDLTMQAAAVAERLGAVVVRPGDDAPIPDGRPIVSVFLGKDSPLVRCARDGERKALNAQGVSAEGLCGAEGVFCRFRGKKGLCDYYRQGPAAADAQIVLATQPHIAAHSVPKALSEGAVGLCLDEDATGSLYSLKHARLDDLRLSRQAKAPAQLKGYSEKQIGEMRDELVALAIKRATEKLSIGSALVELDLSSKGRGAMILAAARATVRFDDERDRAVHPGLTSVQVTEIAARPPQRHRGVSAERLLWQVVEEEYLAAKEVGAQAKLDPRIQLVMRRVSAGEKQPCLRVSRLKSANFSGIPVSVLDATSTPSRLAKVFGRPVRHYGHHVQPHARFVVDATRTYSDSSLLPRSEDTQEKLSIKIATRRSIRRVITKAAHRFRGHGVLVCSTIGVRGWLNSASWAAPENVAFMHFGAERGIDYAKDYKAIIVIGRMEVSVQDNDGIAAAWGATEPFDARGDGLDVNGEPLYRPRVWRRQPCRSGHDVLRKVAEMPEGAAREADHAVREAGLHQAIGRGRLVYREGEPALVIVLGAHLPESYVVDAWATLAVLSADADKAEQARLGGRLTADHVEKRDSSLKGEKLPNYRTRIWIERRADYLRSISPALAHPKIEAKAEADAAVRVLRDRCVEAAVSAPIIEALEDPERLAALGFTRPQIEAFVADKLKNRVRDDQIFDRVDVDAAINFEWQKYNHSAVAATLARGPVPMTAPKGLEAVAA